MIVILAAKVIKITEKHKTCILEFGVAPKVQASGRLDYKIG